MGEVHAAACAGTRAKLHAQRRCAQLLIARWSGWCLAMIKKLPENNVAVVRSRGGRPVDSHVTAVSRYMRISTEILVSAYGLFWAKPPRFAPASLAAGARGSTLLPPPSSFRPMQLHVCSSYASLCYAASLPQPGDRNTAAKRGREDFRWFSVARLGENPGETGVHEGGVRRDGI